MDKGDTMYIIPEGHPTQMAVKTELRTRTSGTKTKPPRVMKVVNCIFHLAGLALMMWQVHSLRNLASDPDEMDNFQKNISSPATGGLLLSLGLFKVAYPIWRFWKEKGTVNLIRNPITFLVAALSLVFVAYFGYRVCKYPEETTVDIHRSLTSAVLILSELVGIVFLEMDNYSTILVFPIFVLLISVIFHHKGYSNILDITSGAMGVLYVFLAKTPSSRKVEDVYRPLAAIGTAFFLGFAFYRIMYVFGGWDLQAHIAEAKTRFEEAKTKAASMLRRNKP